MSDSCNLRACIVASGLAVAFLLGGPGIAVLNAEPLPSKADHHKVKAPKPAATRARTTPRSPLEALGFTTHAGPMPDFIEKSRPEPGELHFIPLGGSRPDPGDRPMTADQIKAQEAELDALRARQDRIVGRKTEVGFRSVAPEPVQPKKKPAVDCVLTCPVGVIVRHKSH